MLSEVVSVNVSSEYTRQRWKENSVFALCKIVRIILRKKKGRNLIKTKDDKKEKKNKEHQIKILNRVTNKNIERTITSIVDIPQHLIPVGKSERLQLNI